MGRRGITAQQFTLLQKSSTQQWCACLPYDTQILYDSRTWARGCRQPSGTTERRPRQLIMLQWKLTCFTSTDLHTGVCVLRLSAGTRLRALVTSQPRNVNIRLMRGFLPGLTYIWSFRWSHHQVNGIQLKKRGSKAYGAHNSNNWQVSVKQLRLAIKALVRVHRVDCES